MLATTTVQATKNWYLARGKLPPPAPLVRTVQPAGPALSKAICKAMHHLRLACEHRLVPCVLCSTCRSTTCWVRRP